jgi:hypothetical protein
MDDNLVECLAYPVMRRIAPLIGGTQIGSNAALSAQTGFPAIAVPAGFTPEGFPVGIELLGRAFAEPTLLGLAFAFEQVTKHRRSPNTTPKLSTKPIHTAGRARPSAAAQCLTTAVAATGNQSVPPSEVKFEALARLSFNPQTRELGYDVEISGEARDEVACVCLHHRIARPNGGVAYILAKSGDRQIRGTLRLTETEAADLLAGGFYVSAISRSNPLFSARGDVVFSASKEPAAGGQSLPRVKS